MPTRKPANTDKTTAPKKKAKDVQKAAGRAGFDESTDRTTGADMTDKRKKTTTKPVKK